MAKVGLRWSIEILDETVRRDAVAEAALDVLIDEDLCRRSRELGSRLAAALASQPLARVEQIRARGLWFGVQLKPEAGPARALCEKLLADGLLCKDTHGHTIRIAPPLVIADDEIDWAAERLVRALR